MKRKLLILSFILLITTLLLITSCSPKSYPTLTREQSIPADAVKMTPELDIYPPILHSDEFEIPVIFEPVSSAGAEDSPFIPIDRDEFYFFFTPDVRVPVEKQVIDNVTGIYLSKRVNGAWQKPERVWLQDPGKLSLDGCQFVRGNEMLFCSVREGYAGIHWATADYVAEDIADGTDDNGKWANWRITDFNPEYQVGELHIHGTELYFHSNKAGGKGDNDIWVSHMLDGIWQVPINVEVVNTEFNDGWPYISQDGNELWFNRFYLGTPGTFRSKRVNGEWTEPELIVSQFAGEPTLDKDGNLYFVHHYYENSQMIEADIYVAYKK